MPFPISQELLADTLGLSVVHTNRVLRKLREAGLVRIEAREMAILDWPGMIRVAKFDDDYLEKSTMPSATRAKLG